MDTPTSTGLLRANVGVAAGTAVSRLTGLVRVVIFGIVIGQTALADAYDGANNSPNSLYELLIGGVFSATLVPLFTRLFHDEASSESEKSAKDNQSGIDAVFSVGIILLAAFTAVAVLLAPQIFHLFALNPSSAVDAEQYRQVGTLLTRVFLIQIFFYGVIALMSAALNARRKFLAAAWAPVASNVVIIVLLLFVPLTVDGEPLLGDIETDSALRWLLSLGSTGGVAVTAVILWRAARNSGISFRFSPQFGHPAVKKLMRLSGWTFGYVAANQVALVVIRNLARPGSGDPDAYTKAYIFFQLPHALLAVSIATTFGPELAKAVTTKRRDVFVERMSLGVRMIALLTLPFSFLTLVAARPVIGALLQHGNFSADAAFNTARALMGFSLGLVGFSVFLFTLRAFYAHEDTRTPFVLNLFENILNIVLAVIFVRHFGVLGLGLAFAVAYLVSAVLALAVLEMKVREFEMKAMLRSLLPMLLAAVVSAQIAWFVGRALGDTAGIGAFVRSVATYLVGIGGYVALLVVLKVPETRQLVQRLRRGS